jgi:hypothetical protein
VTDVAKSDVAARTTVATHLAQATIAATTTLLRLLLAAVAVAAKSFTATPLQLTPVLLSKAAWSFLPFRKQRQLRALSFLI